MTSTENFQPGDRVSILATVTGADDGLVSIAVDGIDSWPSHINRITGEVLPTRLTLVERPEPTQDVSLTKSELLRILNSLNSLYDIYEQNPEASALRLKINDLVNS